MEIKDVAYAFSFPVRSKEREVLLDQLHNRGDFKHNAKVLEKGRGQLVTWKQPSQGSHGTWKTWNLFFPILLTS